MNENKVKRQLPAIVILLCLFFLASCAPGSYYIYSPHESTLTTINQSIVAPANSQPSLPPIPDTWEVVDADFCDVTGDGAPEWVLVVRRPWRDWPVVAWHGGESPIAGFKDRAGKSCHLIVMTPEGRELWAGSALPKPMKAVAAGDIDADGVNEVVTLEADYPDPRHRPARRIDVWKWNVFGFSLSHRSRQGSFRELVLYDADNDGILDIIIR